MPVIGTAGHVDHGKTTLVGALTGRDTDRFEEEKRRGLTIDLGFAWVTLPGGLEVGFVDVPGHERFMKNMLAGVDGLDAALLVVAADEGWMPQTEEHVAVLDLLGVTTGVVALTRTDLVDDETADLAALEVHEYLEGTSLQGAPLVRTAAPRGEGVGDLLAALAHMMDGIPAAADVGRPRMWIDRAFVIAGAGTVVTGTMLDGCLHVGDMLAVWPGTLQARIRAMESHEQTVATAVPGHRTALNLAGVERRRIKRGAMVGREGDWRPTTRVLASVRVVRSLGKPLTERGAYHLHVGTAAHPVRMRIAGSRHIDTSGDVVMTLETPLPLGAGDRFILRDTGRRAVVGGGRILDPHPGRTDAAVAAPRLRSALTEGPDGIAKTLLELRGVVGVTALLADSGGGAPPPGTVIEGTALSAAARASLADTAADLVEAYHRDHPLRPGIPRARLASELDVEAAVAVAVIDDDPRFAVEGATVRMVDFTERWTEAQDGAWERATLELGANLAVPRASSLDLDPDLLHAAVRRGLAVAVADDVVYLAGQIDEIRNRFDELPASFTVSQFRQHFSLSRRHAVPLLEWFDAAGDTVRRGDTRTVKPGK